LLTKDISNGKCGEIFNIFSMKFIDEKISN
jgi:hypothetical protein